jgi:hypothetical protein
VIANAPAGDGSVTSPVTRISNLACSTRFRRDISFLADNPRWCGKVAAALELDHGQQTGAVAVLRQQMGKLEDLPTNAAVNGILSDALVAVVGTQWFGSEGRNLTSITAKGKDANEFMYRHDERRIAPVEQGRPWSVDGDGALFRLVHAAVSLGDEASAKAGNGL